MKVLLITHNPVSTYSNIGKTLDSLFDVFRKEELCQLYTYSSLPDKKKCNSYYQLSDLDVLKSFLKKNKGRILNEGQITDKNSAFESNIAKKAYKLGKNKTPLKMILRDLMWSFLGWKSKKLYSWIEEQKPTHIVVLPGRFKFIYRIAIKISEDFGLPLITYICDDYYFVKDPCGPIGKLYIRLLRKQIKNLLQKTSLLVTICEELTNKFKNIAHVNSITIMTGSNYKIAEKPRYYEKVDKVCYFGNISYKRYESLFDIGKAIDYINIKHKSNIKMRIYSYEELPEATMLFNLTKSIKNMGFVQGDKFKELFFSSPIVLHVESFDDYCIDIVKHSVSTKIADSLASGNCLFAYGPENVSSIQHLIKNNYQAISCSKETLIEKIEKLLFDEDYWVKCVNSSLIIAKKYHNSRTTSSFFYETMSSIL